MYIYTHEKYINVCIDVYMYTPRKMSVNGAITIHMLCVPLGSDGKTKHSSREWCQFKQGIVGSHLQSLLLHCFTCPCYFNGQVQSFPSSVSDMRHPAMMNCDW